MSLISLDQSEYKSLDAKSYDREKRRLRIELLKLQEDVIKNKRKLCIVFEGRDTAGKSTAIRFFSEYLRPQHFNYVQLGIPTKWESSHWFQRWEKALPRKGEISFLERSWYTRAITEPIMGYCSENKYRSFMRKVNKWEDQQMEDGVELTKFYFSLSKNQQEIRMKARKNSELKYWKLSKNDEKIITKWNAFTLYKEQMFDKTSTDNNPWVSINSNNKMIARLTSLRYLLIKTEYEGKKILKPTKWSKSLNNYSTNLEGVNFDNLSYEQFIVLSKYTDS